jgi:hypothetical protein
MVAFLPALFPCQRLGLWRAGSDVMIALTQFEGGAQGFLPEFAKQLLLGKSSNDLPVFILCIGPQGLSADGTLRSQGED